MIQPGERVIALTADRRELPRRALTAIVDGADFPVVWICTEQEWDAASASGRRPDGWPWPAEDVRVATAA